MKQFSKEKVLIIKMVGLSLLLVGLAILLGEKLGYNLVTYIIGMNNAAFVTNWLDQLKQLRQRKLLGIKTASTNKNEGEQE